MRKIKLICLILALNLNIYSQSKITNYTNDLIIEELLPLNNENLNRFDTYQETKFDFEGEDLIYGIPLIYPILLFNSDASKYKTLTKYDINYKFEDYVEDKENKSEFLSIAIHDDGHLDRLIPINFIFRQINSYKKDTLIDFQNFTNKPFKAKISTNEKSLGIKYFNQAGNNYKEIGVLYDVRNRITILARQLDKNIRMVFYEYFDDDKLKSIIVWEKIYGKSNTNFSKINFVWKNDFVSNINFSEVYDLKSKNKNSLNFNSLFTYKEKAMNRGIIYEINNKKIIGKRGNKPVFSYTFSEETLQVYNDYLINKEKIRNIMNKDYKYSGSRIYPTDEIFNDVILKTDYKNILDNPNLTSVKSAMETILTENKELVKLFEDFQGIEREKLLVKYEKFDPNNKITIGDIDYWDNITKKIEETLKIEILNILNTHKNIRHNLGLERY